MDVDLSQGDRIGQVVFSELSTPSEKGYQERSGNYQGKRGITEYIKRE